MPEASDLGGAGVPSYVAPPPAPQIAAGAPPATETIGGVPAAQAIQIASTYLAPAPAPPQIALAPAPPETVGGVPVAQAIEIAATYTTTPTLPTVETEIGGVSPAQAEAIAATYLTGAAATTPPGPDDLAEVDELLRDLEGYAADLTSLETWELVDPFGDRTLAAANPPLKGAGALASMREHARADDVDVLAALANALNEGSGGGIGDKGTAYGPFQIHATDGRLPQFKGKGPNSKEVNAWAWSDNGIAYAFRSMAGAARYPAKGLTGHKAVVAICYGFEKPANIKVKAAERIRTYDDLLRRGPYVWTYAADQLAGPAAGGAYVSPPAGGGAPAPSSPPAPLASFQDLMAYMARTIPATGAGLVADGLALGKLVRYPR